MEPKDIGYLIKHINDKLKVKADADLKSHGLTLSQSRILTILHSRGGQATQKEIEDILEVSHPTVVGIVSRMEQSGYVTTCLDPRQQRSKLVRLTPKASTFSSQLDAKIRDHEADMLRGLTDEQIAQLLEMLQVICSNLS